MPERTIPETGIPKSGIDYVALVGTVVLGAVSCVDLIYGDGSVALAATGGIVGYMVRLYRS